VSDNMFPDLDWRRGISLRNYFMRCLIHLGHNWVTQRSTRTSRWWWWRRRRRRRIRNGRLFCITTPCFFPDENIILISRKFGCQLVKAKKHVSTRTIGLMGAWSMLPRLWPIFLATARFGRCRILFSFQNISRRKNVDDSINSYHPVNRQE